ncbi:hypothetical protein AAY473_012780 [Plecturocebus cupreus]
MDTPTSPQTPPHPPRGAPPVQTPPHTTQTPPTPVDTPNHLQMTPLRQNPPHTTQKPPPHCRCPNLCGRPHMGMVLPCAPHCHGHPHTPTPPWTPPRPQMGFPFRLTDASKAEPHLPHPQPCPTTPDSPPPAEQALTMAACRNYFGEKVAMYFA